jgi:hypothetical protein
MSATAGMTFRASNLESVRASRCDVDCNISKVVTNALIGDDPTRDRWLVSISRWTPGILFA